MTSHDWRMLAVIGVSALCGRGLISMLQESPWPIESFEFASPDIPVEVLEFTVESRVVRPEVAMLWWRSHPPIRTSGLGAVEFGRPNKKSLWRRSSEPLDFLDRTPPFETPRSIGWESVTFSLHDREREGGECGRLRR